MMILANCEGRVGMDPALKVLRDGGSALDAVEQGIRAVEADVTVDSVGRGGSPNLLGEMQCDAAIMDGATRMAGAVGALPGYLHAISVARAIMTRLPHVMLAGEGAARFAREIGAEKAEMLTEESRRRHEQWLRAHVRPDDFRHWPDVPLAPYAWESGKDYGKACHDTRTHGTTVFLVRDAKGDIAAGTSTSGWAQAYPGRIGDSPIIGAGLYADNRYGACGCTHVGEMTIRAGTARSVVLHMKAGASVQEACYEAMRDLRELKGGQIGEIVIHALDRDGNPCVLSSLELLERSSYYYWTREMPEMEHRQAEVQRTDRDNRKERT
jgi:L-asparaginase